jgi:hypothetical protein
MRARLTLKRTPITPERRVLAVVLWFIMAGLQGWLTARLLSRGDNLGYLSLAVAIGFVLVATLGYRRRG